MQERKLIYEIPPLGREIIRRGYAVALPMLFIMILGGLLFFGVLQIDIEESVKWIVLVFVTLMIFMDSLFVIRAANMITEIHLENDIVGIEKVRTNIRVIDRIPGRRKFQLTEKDIVKYSLTPVKTLSDGFILYRLRAKGLKWSYIVLGQQGKERLEELRG